ncbi:MAG TPA: thiolase family protein [Polyangiales bacterium]
MARPEVFIVAAARTPIGSFQGALARVTAPRLGSIAMQRALAGANLEGAQIEEVFMGNVLSAGLGQAPARQAAIYAGLPNAVPATTVSKVCGSGLQAVLLGVRSILCGDNQLVMAGGMESMSNAPYLLPKARGGYRMGHGELLDGMILDGLWDPYHNIHMGIGGECCAREFGFDRAAQDEYARESYERARRAQREGAFASELTPVVVKGSRGEQRIEQDEEPERTDLSRMAALSPVFEEGGSITPANASKINDGASALVLASGEAVRRFGLNPLARVVAYGGHAQEPDRFATAPVFSTLAALKRAGLSAADIDLWEINEAFAVVTMTCMRELGLDKQRVNVNGGAVALGHPIGASGARIVTTLVHAMRARAARRGVAAICIGGGEALSLVVEA